MTCTTLFWLGMGINLCCWIGAAVYWAIQPKREQTRLEGMDRLVPPKLRKSSGDQ
jgi:hypothetical protein